MKRKNNEVIENKVFENVTFDAENPACGVYEECRFTHCNLNAADLSEVTFRNCTFDGCDLSLAKLNETGFQEVRFANSKLLGLQFCDLTRTTFDHTILEQADFRTAYNFSINPATNRIRKARFSLAGVAGLLDVYGVEIE